MRFNEIQITLKFGPVLIIRIYMFSYNTYMTAAGLCLLSLYEKSMLEILQNIPFLFHRRKWIKSIRNNTELNKLWPFTSGPNISCYYGLVQLWGVCVVSVDRINSSLVQLIMENHNLHYRDDRDRMQQVLISDSEILAFCKIYIYILLLRNFTKLQWNWSGYIACVVLCSNFLQPHLIKCWVGYSKIVINY